MQVHGKANTLSYKIKYKCIGGKTNVYKIQFKRRLSVMQTMINVPKVRCTRGAFLFIFDFNFIFFVFILCRFIIYLFSFLFFFYFFLFLFSSFVFFLLLSLAIILGNLTFQCEMSQIAIIITSNDKKRRKQIEGWNVHF